MAKFFFSSELVPNTNTLSQKDLRVSPTHLCSLKLVEGANKTVVCLPATLTAAVD